MAFRHRMSACTIFWNLKQDSGPHNDILSKSRVFHWLLIKKIKKMKKIKFLITDKLKILFICNLRLSRLIDSLMEHRQKCWSFFFS